MTDLVIRREQKQARYFVEKLGVEKLADSVNLDMILVPGNTFIMGSPDDEPERDKDRELQHEVMVLTFFMGRYPVTQAQWQFVAGLPQINRELKPDPSRFKGNNRPVERVSWYEAVEFCDRLSVRTGRPYRLPSEAEWEYACRAGTTTPFYFGKTLTADLVNYHAEYTYNDGPTGEYRRETTLVDHFGIANAFGLCDMHGNVWEWCQDHWHDSYEGAPTDGSAWLSENESASRVRRGGSWYNDPRSCRSACRNSFSPDYTDGDIGFRVVCSAPRT
jgi:formylglycine-generating enzyme required for sulfatase activity